MATIGSSKSKDTNCFLIKFYTKKFDVSKESENPINPIYGQSLLLWLQEKLGNVYEIDSPEPEDWGWYSYINWNGTIYMLGSFAEKESDDLYYWQLMVEKQRTLKSKMTIEDECLQYLLSLIESEPEFRDIKIE